MFEGLGKEIWHLVYLRSRKEETPSRTGRNTRTPAMNINMFSDNTGNGDELMTFSPVASRIVVAEQDSRTQGPVVRIPYRSPEDITQTAVANPALPLDAEVTTSDRRASAVPSIASRHNEPGAPLPHHDVTATPTNRRTSMAPCVL